MDKIRRAEAAPRTSQTTVSCCEADAFARARMGEPMRDLLAAGGRCGFTTAEMFPERAA